MAKEIKSVENMKMYINQIFEFAISMEIIIKNPIKGVTIPRKEEEHLASSEDDTRNYWEKSEIKKFLEVVKQDCSFRDYVMFHLLIYTGGRKGEVLALTFGDIDFKSKTLNFNKTLFHENEQFISLTSKTVASRRLISLDDTTVGLLKKMRTEPSRGQVVRIDSKDPVKIFTREDNTPLRLAYPNDKLDVLIKAHGLHPITVHGLRHTHASLLFEAGASIKEVQERLGHSDIKMTMNIYTHVTKTIKEQTASRFEKFMEL